MNKKRLLKSFIIGFATILFLYLVAAFGAAHQDIPVVGGLGYVAAGLIDMPIIYMYGADGGQQPSLLVVIAVYLSEAIIVSVFLYLIFLVRDKGR